MRIRTALGLSQRLRDEPSSRGEFLVFVSRVFAPAPGSAARIRVASMNYPTPFKKPQGRATRCWSSLVFVSRDFAPAPGSAARIRVANMNYPTPFKKHQGRATRCWSSLVFVSRVFAPAPGSAAKFWNKPIKDSYEVPHYGDRPPCRRSPTATRLFAPTGRFSLA
jgi:hypothetical protein